MRIVPSEDYAGHCASAKKLSKVVSKKPEFGHLRVKGENDDDDDPRAEKNFPEVVSLCPIFPM